VIVLPHRDHLKAPDLWRCPARAGRSSSRGRRTAVPPQRTSWVPIQRHPRHRACADRRGCNCRRSSKRGAVGYGITNRNLLAIRRRGSVSCGPPARSVIIGSAAPPQIIPKPW